MVADVFGYLYVRKPITCSHYRSRIFQLHGDVCTSMGCFVRQPGYLEHSRICVPG